MCKVILLLLLASAAASKHGRLKTGRAPVMCTIGQRRPNDANSSTYFDCQESLWKLTNCPADSIFSPVALQCQSNNLAVQLPIASQPNCNNGEIYPDNLNKTLFYVCYQGSLQSQVCPQGMVFSSTNKYCEIGNSACGDTPNGGFVKANQPNNFYVCQNGQLQLQICPSGQFFNSFLGYCSATGLIPGPNILPPPPPPPTPSFNCGPLQQGQFVADLNNQSHYFVCILGKLWRQNCPANTIFNNITLTCVNTPNSVAKNSHNCGPYSVGYCFQDCNPANANAYFECVLGVFILRQCPVGQIGNENCTCTPSPNARQSALLKSNGKQNNGNLNVLSLKNSDSTKMETCLKGFIYNPDIRQCINPCDTRDPDIPARIQTYFVPDIKNPASFYLCNGKYIGKTGVATQLTELDRLQCPNGQQFYSALTTRPDPCMSQSTISKYCQSNPTQTAVALTVNKKCTTPSLNPYYIKCSTLIPTIERCPRGMVLYLGKCVTTGYQCDSPTIDTSSQNYICVCE